MGFFRRKNEVAGWRAITFHPAAALAVHVQRPLSGRPLVTMLAAEPTNGASPTEVLTRLAKGWPDAASACTTAVNPDSYHFLPVDAPNVPANELKSAIAWTVTDMIDFSNEEATIDILAVPHDYAGTQRVRSMYAVVIRSKLASDIQSCFHNAKLRLKAIDIPEMAQRNIAALLEPEGRAITLVSFDASGGLLTFSGEGDLFMARRIDVTLLQLQAPEPLRRQEAHEIVALEIQRSLDHFSRKFNWVELSGVMVAPIGEDDGGLVAYLKSNLDTDLSALNLETILDISRVSELKSLSTQQKYFITLGLALRHEEKVL